MSALQTGELSEETFCCKEVAWKIREFWSLSDNPIQSPSFIFANATWCLCVYRNEQKDWKNEPEDWGWRNVEKDWRNKQKDWRNEQNDWRNEQEDRGWRNKQKDWRNKQNDWRNEQEDRRWRNKQKDWRNEQEDWRNEQKDTRVISVCMMKVRLHSLQSDHTVFWKCGIFGTDHLSEYLVNRINDDYPECGSIKLVCKKDEIMPEGILTLFCRLRVKKDTSVEGSSGKEIAELTTNIDKLLQDYKDLLLNETGSDVTIRVQGQDFRAHRHILGARSPVFASMFRNEMKEKATGVVDIDDCDPASFPDFLRFLYTGSVEELSTKNVFGLYTTADKYDISGLKSDCLQFMYANLIVDTFCDTVTVALRHCETQLIKVASEFLAKNLSKIIVTVKWQAFLVENPIQANELLVKAFSDGKSV